MSRVTGAGRRHFLKTAGAFGASALLPGLSVLEADAQGTSDYKALVCVFLYGGNDGNNMIVPYTSTEYSAYAAARGAPSDNGLALARGSLLPLSLQSGSPSHAFHPSMTGLQGLWNQGKVTALFNVGTLVRPLTKAQFIADATLGPIQLLSHTDQQIQVQNASADFVIASGWGGRIADHVSSSSTGALPIAFSVGAGNVLMLTGDKVNSVQVPSAGVGVGNLDLDNIDMSSPASAARYNALKQVSALQPSELLIATLGGLQSDSLNLRESLNPIISGSSALSSHFTDVSNSYLGQPLLQVAKIIEKRSNLGAPGRQIFFVGHGPYDTHNGQLPFQADMLAELSACLSDFYQATAALGLADRITTFTMSDFGRSLRANGGAGSDHAWGNHQLIMGGAVKGNATFGNFPQQVLGGPDDVGNGTWLSSGTGTWLPTTSIEQYGATLATWFGVNAADLNTVFPNLKNFASANMGFMTA